MSFCITSLKTVSSLAVGAMLIVSVSAHAQSVDARLQAKADKVVGATVRSLDKLLAATIKKEDRAHVKFEAKIEKIRAKAQSKGLGVCFPSKCDVDLEGAFTDTDLNIISLCSTLDPLLFGLGCARADVTGDGEINSADLDFCSDVANQEADCVVPPTATPTPEPTNTPEPTPIG